MLKGQKVGVPTSTVLKPSTKKEKADRKARQKLNRQDAARNKRISNTLYGALTYRCSNSECKNLVRIPEEVGDRKILCTKCNNGFFNVLVKDDRKNLAKQEDFRKKNNVRPKKRKRSKPHTQSFKKNP